MKDPHSNIIQDLSPMADVHHQDQETRVVDLVEDAIITDANWPGIPPAEFLNSMGPGLIGQAADGTGYPVPVLCADP